MGITLGSGECHGRGHSHQQEPTGLVPQRVWDQEGNRSTWLCHLAGKVSMASGKAEQDGPVLAGTSRVSGHPGEPPCPAAGKRGGVLIAGWLSLSQPPGDPAHGTLRPGDSEEADTLCMCVGEGQTREEEAGPGWAVLQLCPGLQDSRPRCAFSQGQQGQLRRVSGWDRSPGSVFEKQVAPTFQEMLDARSVMCGPCGDLMDIFFLNHGEVCSYIWFSF